MERMLATPADAEIILKLYQLRTEAADAPGARLDDGRVLARHRREFFAVALNPADPHNACFRQVITYWEMAAAMVLHGAVSAELFVDCNGEGFFLLAKFAHILEAIRREESGFMTKTSELVNRFSAAAARYEVVLKNVEARRKSMAAKSRMRVNYSSCQTVDSVACRNRARGSMMEAGPNVSIPWRFQCETMFAYARSCASLLPPLRRSAADSIQSTAGSPTRCAAPSTPAPARPA